MRINTCMMTAINGHRNTLHAGSKRPICDGMECARHAVSFSEIDYLVVYLGFDYTYWFRARTCYDTAL